MTKAEAEHLIAQAISSGGGVGFTKHFWDEARKCAPGLSRNEVYRALRVGYVVGAPVRDDPYVCHKVRVRAKIPDRGLYELVVGISLLDDVFCITIYDLQ
jgi:hypothetical protein